MQQSGAIRLASKLAIIFSVLAILAMLLVISVLYYLGLQPYLRNAIRAQLRDAVSVGALSVDVDAHATLTDPADADSPTFIAVQEQLRQVRDATANARFVYTLRQDAQGNIYFVVDAEEDPDDVSYFGDIYEDPGPLLAENFATLDAPLVEEAFYTDEWGTWLSGYAPLYTSDGELDAILAMDFEASFVVAQQREVLFMALLVLVAMTPVIATLGWIVGRQSATPLMRLTLAAQRIAEGDLKQKVDVRGSREVNELSGAFNVMTERLRELVGRLEERVAERTGLLERRAAYLRATGEVSRGAASILDLEELLEQTVTLISERFGFYQAGIFLLDERREWAVLQAASSPGGRRMLARGHRLRVGEQGIVGYVTQTGRPRIALDVGEDAQYFDNPDLPETRSEMAVPLLVRGRIIGALDVQSRESGAFGPEEVAILRILADQIAVAIDNARLFAENRRTLEDLRRAYGMEVGRAWAGRESEGETVLGYHYTAQAIEPLVDAAALPHIEADAPQVAEDNILLVPLLVSGVNLGVLRLQREAQQRWTTREIEFVRRLADEISQAMQNANLLERTRTTATRERLVAEIAEQLRASLNPDIILKTTVRALGQALAAEEVAIRVTGPEAMETTSGEGL